MSDESIHGTDRAVEGVAGEPCVLCRPCVFLCAPAMALDRDCAFVAPPPSKTEPESLPSPSNHVRLQDGLGVRHHAPVTRQD